MGCDFEIFIGYCDKCKATLEAPGLVPDDLKEDFSNAEEISGKDEPVYLECPYCDNTIKMKSIGFLRSSTKYEFGVKRILWEEIERSNHD